MDQLGYFDILRGAIQWRTRATELAFLVSMFVGLFLAEIITCVR